MDITAFIKINFGYILSLVALALLILLGYELWEDLREWLEDYWVKKLRRSTAKNLNSEAVQKIKKRLNGQDSFRFAVIGDTQNRFKPLQKILHTMAEDNIDFIIHAGDFTSSGRYMQYIKMARFAGTLNVPVVFAIGNHDISNYGTECFAHFMGPLNFYFDCGQCRFIFLNSTLKEFVPDIVAIPQPAYRPGRRRGMEAEQIHNLETALQGNTHSFIIMHTPPAFDAFKHHGFTRNLDRFVAVMKKYSPHIAGVFCGHIHGYAELLVDDVQYIITGGAGERLHASREGIINKFNYVLVTVAQDKVSHQVKFIS